MVSYKNNAEVFIDFSISCFVSIQRNRLEEATRKQLYIILLLFLLESSLGREIAQQREIKSEENVYKSNYCNA